jgi:AraC-like DNA-binding protein
MILLFLFKCPRRYANILFAPCGSGDYITTLCGMTVGEYIRARRMTLAAQELACSDHKVIEIAMKYGYDSPDSFAKAFQRFHGIIPSQAREAGANLRSFAPLHQDHIGGW